MSSLRAKANMLVKHNYVQPLLKERKIRKAKNFRKLKSG
jgi:hypothetical protein